MIRQRGYEENIAVPGFNILGTLGLKSIRQKYRRNRKLKE